MTDNFEMVAKTLFGFEELLEKELLQLGAQKIKTGVRNVSFYGDKGFMYKCNIGLRTAIKILKPIKKFRVKNEAELYSKIKEIQWENFLDVNGTLAVGSTLSGSLFTHSQYVSLKTKDAIVDRFRDKFGSRPNVDLRHPDIKIDVHIERSYCTVSLDSSGESLHKRGYRISTNIAPINEVLAAGLVMMSGWSGESDFMDPMCGSGTILIEAAMIACNIPPNLMRNEFGFESWKDWDAYKAGIIDENGKRKKGKKADGSWTPFIRLCANIKRILEKVPGGSSKLGSFAAALYLIKENLNLNDKQIAKICESCEIDVLDFLNENSQWFVLEDKQLAPGVYRVREAKVLNSTIEELCNAKDQIRVSDDAYPIGDVFGVDIYEATHIKTNQKVYVTIKELYT